MNIAFFYGFDSSGSIGSPENWYLRLSRVQRGRLVPVWEALLVRRRRGLPLPNGTLARYLAQFGDASLAPNGLSVSPHAPDAARKLLSEITPGYAVYLAIPELLTVRCSLIGPDGRALGLVEQDAPGSVVLDREGFLVTPGELELIHTLRSGPGAQI
jgi:hypothetical protein